MADLKARIEAMKKREKKASNETRTERMERLRVQRMETNRLAQIQKAKDREKAGLDFI
jgi:hypothetical protein